MLAAQQRVGAVPCAARLGAPSRAPRSSGSSGQLRSRAAGRRPAASGRLQVACSLNNSGPSTSEWRALRQCLRSLLVVPLPPPAAAAAASFPSNARALSALLCCSRQAGAAGGARYAAAGAAQQGAHGRGYSAASQGKAPVLIAGALVAGASFGERCSGWGWPQQWQAGSCVAKQRPLRQQRNSAAAAASLARCSHPPPASPPLRCSPAALPCLSAYALLLQDCQLSVVKPNPRQYVARISQLPGLEVWFQRATGEELTQCVGAAGVSLCGLAEGFVRWTL